MTNDGASTSQQNECQSTLNNIQLLQGNPSSEYIYVDQQSVPPNIVNGSNRMVLEFDQNGTLMNYVVVDNPVRTAPATNNNTDTGGSLDISSIDPNFLNFNVENETNNITLNLLLRLEEKIDNQTVLLKEIQTQVNGNTENIRKCVKFIVNTEKFMLQLPQKKNRTYQNLQRPMKIFQKL